MSVSLVFSLKDSSVFFSKQISALEQANRDLDAEMVEEREETELEKRKLEKAVVSWNFIVLFLVLQTRNLINLQEILLP